jgi:hypothetical protein
MSGPIGHCPTWPKQCMTCSLSFQRPPVGQCLTDSMDIIQCRNTRVSHFPDWLSLSFDVSWWLHIVLWTIYFDYHCLIVTVHKYCQQRFLGNRQVHQELTMPISFNYSCIKCVIEPPLKWGVCHLQINWVILDEARMQQTYIRSIQNHD